MKRIFIFFYIILVFMLLSSFSFACDWEVSIISDNVFENESSFSFKYQLTGTNKTNITLFRYVEDLYGSVVKIYDNYTVESTSQHTTPTLSPNIGDGAFLIKGNIVTDCNDTNLENNDIEKLIYILSEPQLSNNYSSISISEFLPNPKGDDNAPMPGGEWIELYNSGENAIDLENLTIYDNLGVDPDITISDTNTINTTIIESNSYLVVYTNGKLVLNNDGFEKISLYSGTTLIDEVTYDGSSEDVSWSKFGGLWIQTPPTPNKQNFQSQTLLDTSLNILAVYDLGTDDKAEFGQTIRVKLSLYKGDETKNVVQVWAGTPQVKISKVAQITLPDKFTNTTIVVPISLFQNCGGEYREGDYQIYLGWYGESAEKDAGLEVINAKCKDVVTTTVIQQTSLANTQEFQQETYSQNPSSSILFTSSNEKSLDILSFSIMITLLLGYLILFFY